MNLSLTAAQEADLLNAIRYQTSRSGGKGGQNVNKVETQVDAELDTDVVSTLSPEQKERILLKNGSAVLRARSNRNRSQLRNREEAALKLIEQLRQMLKVQKKRRPTKPGKAAKEKKLREKKKRSEKKELRRRPL
jgi:ribosome-associated protein